MARDGRWRAMASVARNSSTSAPSATLTRATIWPGSACSSNATSSSPGCAAPAMPTVDERSSITCTPSSFPPVPRASRCTGAATAASATSLAVIPADSSAAFHAATASGRPAISLKRSSQTFVRSSPGARHRSMCSSVTLALPTSSATIGPSASLPTTNAAAASPCIASSVLPARPVRTSALTTSDGVLPDRARSSAPTADLGDSPMSNAAAVDGNCNAACTPVALVLSAYAGVVVPKRTCAGVTSLPRAREPRRLDRHRGGVLVVAGDRAGALPATLTDEGGDLGPVEPPVGQIRSPRQNPAHVGQGIRGPRPVSEAARRASRRRSRRRRTPCGRGR